MKSPLHLALGLALALTGLTMSPGASATLITFSYQATVDTVDSPLGSQFSIGDTFTFTYTFERRLPLQRLLPCRRSRDCRGSCRSHSAPATGP